MTVILAAALFTLGLYLTMKGGDSFVDAAACIAEASGVPRFIVGATIVSLCTTAPELTVSLLATIQGSTGLAVGNAVGSAACNAGLILGLNVLLAPTLLSAREAQTKGGLMVITACLLGVFSMDGLLSAPESLVLLAMLGVFLFMNLRSASQGRQSAQARLRLQPGETFSTGAKFVAGAAAVVLGAKLMVDNGILLARFIGIPESVIGLTLVALGTSLPELVTALAAVRRHEGSISAGNIIGANIIDLSLVLPACAAMSGGGLPVEAAVGLRDLPFTVVIMSIAMLPPMFSGRLRRIQGAALLLVYAWYIWLVMHGIA